MPDRLDTQRPPSKVQSRPDTRKMVRGYSARPQTNWGTTKVPADTAASTVTAGAPGTFGPASSLPPETPGNLIAGIPNRITPSPATAWTTGQYVQTQLAGAPGRAYWNGTIWVQGTAP